MKGNLKTTAVLPRLIASHSREAGAGSANLCRPKPTLAIRVPLAPENRCYLRALRAAELAEWKSLVELRTVPVAKGNKLSLRAQIASVDQERRKESWLFVVIASVSLWAVAYGVWNSLELIQKWPEFETFVGRWLG